jgi:membrane-associated HD superfamily phosphohydrolase
VDVISSIRVPRWSPIFISALFNSRVTLGLRQDHEHATGGHPDVREESFRWAEAKPEIAIISLADAVKAPALF